MAEEPQTAPLPDDWPLAGLERLEIELRLQVALWFQLRADVDDLTARMAGLTAQVAELERQRARDNED